MEINFIDQLDEANISECSNVLDQSSFITAQYWLIAVFGNTICFVGIVCNIALLQVLFQRKLRTTYLIYSAVLAIMDILILITYVLVPVIGVLYEYYENYILYRLWHIYVPYFYTLSRIVTLAGTYLVLACTVERYWEVVQLHNQKTSSTVRQENEFENLRMTQSKRYIIVAVVVLASVAFRFVVLFELDIEVKSECADTFSYVGLKRTKSIIDIDNYVYSEIYSFWAVHIVQVFFPFPALVLLNALIIFTWRSVLKNRRKQSIELKRFIERSKSARSMMVSIVTSYLICNTLQMVITCWEHIDKDFLDRHDDFYALASDVVSLLTAINASSRLPIYYASNSTIRMAIEELWLSKTVHQIVYVGSLKKQSLRRKYAQFSRRNTIKENRSENQSMLIDTKC